MKLELGSEQYRKALRRWNTLNWLDNPTERQQAEKARLDAALSAAELSVFAAVTYDYEDLAQTGDLGGVEL